MNIRRLLGDSSGAAAVEFALLAPLLILAFLGMVDLGFANYEHMRLDQIARDAAEAAMAGRQPAELVPLLDPATDPKRSIGGRAMTYSLKRVVQCAESSLPLSNPTGVICADGRPPPVFIDITLNLIHPGFVLGEFRLESHLRVQQR